MTVGAHHACTVERHVDVEVLGCRQEVWVQVSVFHSGTTTAIEVAGAAGFVAGLAHVLSDHRKVRRFPDHSVEVRRLIGGVSRCRGELLIGAGRVVAGDTVHVLFDREVERVVRPSVPGVATRTPWFVGLDPDAEVVDLCRLADSFAVVVVPGPVGCLLDLLGGLGVARQARGCEIWPCGEVLLEDLELAVIGRRIGTLHRYRHGLLRDLDRFLFLRHRLGLSNRSGCNDEQHCCNECEQDENPLRRSTSRFHRRASSGHLQLLVSIQPTHCRADTDSVGAKDPNSRFAMPRIRRIRGRRPYAGPRWPCPT